MNRRLQVATVVVLMAGTGLDAGQNRAPADLQTPTFKVQVDYVEVDAVVTDARGNFVHNLKAEDFQVFEDGQPQTISVFSIVDIPIDRYEKPLFASRPIEPDTKTNERPFEGRIYVMVIDDLHTNFARTLSASAATRKFIEERLGANDLMAVVHIGGPADASQEFTNNKRLLLAAVDRTLGQKLESPTLSKTAEYFRTRTFRQAGDPLRDPEEIERNANAVRSLDTLKGIADFLGGRARAAQDHSVRQRGDRLRPRQCAQQLRRLAVARQCARDDRCGDERERQHFRHRSTRARPSQRRHDRTPTPGLS
jgi:VWFA-related protein